MNPDEVYVVYHLLTDKIVSVHANRVLAAARYDVLRTAPKGMGSYTIMNLPTAVEYIVQHEKTYGD